MFLYGGGMAEMPEALHAFEYGVHKAFVVSFGTTLVGRSRQICVQRTTRVKSRRSTQQRRDNYICDHSTHNFAEGET